MQLCHQPRQRVEQDPGESEKPLLTLFINHPSMTIHRYGYPFRPTGGFAHLPPFVRGRISHVYSSPRVADEPYPGL